VGGTGEQQVERMSSVTIQRLWMEYGSHVVLENLNLHIKEHEFVTIVGASGCGKTTFLRLLLGIEAPTRGQILIDDQPLQAEPGPDRGIVFQRYSLFPHLSVLDNLLLAADFAGARWTGRLFGARRHAAKEEALQLLDTVGLYSARDKYPSQLSGGMQQRLSIAQSIFREPKILLLDEPFGALDPGLTADMHALIRELWSTKRMTIFMITHDVKESFTLGTRVLVFDKPRIDAHEPERYGATVTLDIKLQNRRNPVEQLERARAAALIA
jgi:NitT/TauT family transport system ATP-binding protein